MLEFPRWKYLIITCVLLISALYALPNIYQKNPSVQITGSNSLNHVDVALGQRVSAKWRPALRQ